MIRVMEPPKNPLIASPEDARAFKRYPTSLTALVRLAADADVAGLRVPKNAYEWRAAHVQDLSMTGLFFQSDAAYPLGALLEFQIALDGQRHHVHARARRHLLKNIGLHLQFGGGVDFLQSRMGKDFRLALAQYLWRQGQADPPPA